MKQGGSIKLRSIRVAQLHSCADWLPGTNPWFPWAIISRLRQFLLNPGTLGSKTACLKSARQWPTAWERRAAIGVRRRGDAGGASADSPSDHESSSEHEESGAEDELGGQEDPETERTGRGYGVGKENMLFRRLMVEDGEPAGPSSRAPILSTRPTRACIVTTASSASCLRKKIRRRSTAQTR
jgi:hypothetical protein